jgi:hypothetical protein
VVSEDYMGAGLYQAMVIIKDLMFIIATARFMVHFYLAVVHPVIWQSLVSMRYGVVSESYAREHPMHHARRMHEIKASQPVDNGHDMG